jgi:RNA polymerase sigma-70 factor (ECF subfamily)
MTDADLVVRAREGDTDAFATLVLRYYDECGRFARRMLANHHDAEEALQDALLSAYRGLGRYRERDSFRAWLFQIVINRCRSVARERARREARFIVDDEAVARAEVPVNGTDVPDEAVHACLTAAVGRLDPLLREALLLKHGAGLEYTEMARVTGASVPALKMRVKRACDALRPQLQALYHD